MCVCVVFNHCCVTRDPYFFFPTSVDYGTVSARVGSIKVLGRNRWACDDDAAALEDDDDDDCLDVRGWEACALVLLSVLPYLTLPYYLRYLIKQYKYRICSSSSRSSLLKLSSPTFIIKKLPVPDNSFE